MHRRRPRARMRARRLRTLRLRPASRVEGESALAGRRRNSVIGNEALMMRWLLRRRVRRPLAQTRAPRQRGRSMAQTISLTPMIPMMR